MTTPIGYPFPPQWFKRAMATPGESCFVEVAGCPIHYLRWGDPANPGLVLIPGNGGHAHWFSHVAPLLADQFQVVAMDLGGCGDSGRREVYSLELVIAEIVGVCARAGMLEAKVPPVLLGHSVGGHFAVRTAIAHGKALLGVIALDSLRYAQLEKDPIFRAGVGPRPAPRPPRVYPDFASAVARFRLMPDPEVPIKGSYILDHIARHSVREGEGGWGWKHDGGLASLIAPNLDLAPALRELDCRAAAIYGETTHITDETMLEAMKALTGGAVPVFTIPGSGHFPMLDSPIAFVSAVKGVALAWVTEWLRRDRRM